MTKNKVKKSKNIISFICKFYLFCMIFAGSLNLKAAEITLNSGEPQLFHNENVSDDIRVVGSSQNKIRDITFSDATWSGNGYVQKDVDFFLTLRASSIDAQNFKTFETSHFALDLRESSSLNNTVGSLLDKAYEKFTLSLYENRLDFDNFAKNFSAKNFSLKLYKSPILNFHQILNRAYDTFSLDLESQTFDPTAFTKDFSAKNLELIFNEGGSISSLTGENKPIEILNKSYDNFKLKIFTPNDIADIFDTGFKAKNFELELHDSGNFRNAQKVLNRFYDNFSLTLQDSSFDASNFSSDFSTNAMNVFLKGNATLDNTEKLFDINAPISLHITPNAIAKGNFGDNETDGFPPRFNIFSSSLSDEGIKMSLSKNANLLKIDNISGPMGISFYLFDNLGFEQNGFTVTLDAQSSNLASIFLDKKESRPYQVRFGGIIVGKIKTLEQAISNPADDPAKTYQAILNPNAAFIGKLDIQDRKIAVELSQGSKLILENDSKIALLGASDGTKSFDLYNDRLADDTLVQSNTMIDLFTRGTPSGASYRKETYSKLTIEEIRDVNNAVFRVGYNPLANTIEEVGAKADRFIIEKVTNTDSATTINYIQAYQNKSSLSPVIGDLSDKKILVASVKNETTGSKEAKTSFYLTSKVKQGYDIVTTNFMTKKEGSADGTGSSGEEYTNYYVKSAGAQFDPNSKILSESAITTNYSIFLANINNLNKRMGELRNNPLAQGVWARVFSGLSTSKYGEEVQTYSTNFQAGYDYSLAHNSENKSYLGLALSYGYNVIKSKNKEFDAKANLFEIGMYYSYVAAQGFYSDTIAKYASIGNNLNLSSTSEKTDTSLNSNTLSIGEEIGYRWAFLLKEGTQSKHGLYLEPQVEVIGGYIGEGGFDQINGNAFLTSGIDGILAFRARAGAVLAYTLQTTSQQTDFRVGLSYVGDYIGNEGKISYKTNFAEAFSKLSSNHMTVASLGINSMIFKNWRVYGDLDLGFGGTHYNHNYLVSVGGRYSFGGVNQRVMPSSSLATQEARLAQGYYWEVYSIPDTMQLSKEQVGLLQKYPHAIERSYRDVKDASGKVRKVLYRTYYLGGFKTQEGASKNQKIADDVSSILYNKASKALLRQVK